MTLDPGTPDVQLRLLIAEFVITIAALEAQKAQLSAEKADLVRQLAEALAPQVLP
jgi:hypothetical protein